jgi:acyl-CoA thioesterase
MRSLHESLALAGSGGTYLRVIGEDWTFADRVFGGYTAALAATAARSESPHSSLLAAHVMFLEAARPTDTWEQTGPAPGWLNLVAEAGPSDDAFVACTGTIRSQDGTVRATAGQQGRIFPGWPRG